MEEKKMTLEEMQQACLEVSFEIAKTQSIHKKLLKKFDDLSYKIWKMQKEKENESASVEKSDN